jgi:hypothetical protein
VDRAGDAREIGLALLLQQKREEEGLEEEVSELVLELCGIAADRRIRDLVRLFDRMRNDRTDRLLTVPRTVAAQPFG